MLYEVLGGAEERPEFGTTLKYHGKGEAYAPGHHNTGEDFGDDVEQIRCGKEIPATRENHAELHQAKSE